MNNGTWPIGYPVLRSGVANEVGHWRNQYCAFLFTLLTQKNISNPYKSWSCRLCKMTGFSASAYVTKSMKMKWRQAATPDANNSNMAFYCRIHTITTAENLEELLAQLTQMVLTFKVSSTTTLESS